MKLKFAFILSFILLSGSLFAASAKQEAQKLKRELELDLQEHLTTSLKQRYGLDQVLVTAEVKLDQKGLLRSWGIEQESTLTEASLPGFASPGYDAQLLKNVSVTEARGFIDQLHLKLHVFSDDYDRTQLEKFVTLLATNYAKISEQKITIESDATNFQLLKPKTATIQDQEKTSAMDFIRNHWQIFFFSVLSAFALFFLTWTLRNGFKTIGKNISPAQGSMASSSIGDRRTVATGSVTLNDSLSEKSMINLLAIRGELELLGRKHSRELENLVQIKAELGEPREALMLLECVDPEQREMVLHRLMKTEGLEGDDFLSKFSQDLLQNYQNAPAKTADLLRLFKLALLRPSSLRKVALLDALHHLPMPELVQLYRSSSADERKFLQTYLPEVSVGHLVANVKFPLGGHEQVKQSVSENELMSALVNSIGAIRKSMSEKHDTERRLRIYAHMPYSEGEGYADQMGIPAELRFSSLHEKYKSAGQNFVKSLSFEKMSALLAMLEPEIRSEILKGLPEILAERLKFVRHQDSSSALRGEFYFYLFQIHQDTSLVADSAIELKAA